MMRYLFTILLLGTTIILQAQVRNLSPLKIEEIMKGADFVGTSPGSPQWSLDSKSIYFSWNPDNEKLSSLYKYDLSSSEISKVSDMEQKELPSFYGRYNPSRSRYLYSKNGDLFEIELRNGKRLQITNTVQSESSAQYAMGDNAIVFRSGLNYYVWRRTDGSLRQLTNFTTSSSRGNGNDSPQEAWLKQDQMAMFEVLQEEKDVDELRKERRNALRVDRPIEIKQGKDRLSGITVSPSLNYVTFTRIKRASGKRTKVPHYVTESGYLDVRNARSKVGDPADTYSLHFMDVLKDTVFEISMENLPGIYDKPSFFKEYHSGDEAFNPKYDKPRPVVISSSIFSEGGKAVVTIRAQDNKDRWLALINFETASLEVIEHQHDEAWIGGPGISGWGSSQGIQGWLPDNETYYFISEETGFSHLYTYNITTKTKKALTNGDWEVVAVRLSKDKKHFYLVTSEVDPGERHFYSMPVTGGKRTQITTLEGNNNPTLSPNEKYIAVRFSTSNRPWELGLMPNKPGAEMDMLTDSRTDSFKGYEWRRPELVYFKAEDGANVRARLYKPKDGAGNGAAVVFVHGAGYLQNVHKWWSSYYREYMFHNLLADNGYTVLDIDFRASSGYGRDWRTGIYRHMGGKDLSDQVDGAKYLVENHGVDAGKIGIYGGSYGGFITLMAMFTSPGTFNCGAALRSVTDWAHYNHGYTSNILNTPVTDSIAYRKSSPIYHAEGLEGQLLMLHGMVDSNVQFQDVVRLSQRLIELGKDNWELAVFPVEGHGFTTASGWTDEYKRIFKLFQKNLNPAP